ncbi:MAG TPA: sugar ABC transporter permease [Kofleriaceae bacterium]|nr:sugar ABC transporter permease [Kofleriaceae bacterium]
MTRQASPPSRRLSHGLDPRMVSMLLALAAIWIALHILTDGVFLTPRNLYNLSIQASAIAVIACGMVFVIVARQIDLSVGSLLAFTGVLTAAAQVRWMETHPTTGWILSILVGFAAGALVGVFQGWWIAYRGIPALVVTLAGFLMYRGAAFLVAEGQTIAPLDPTYDRLGGGPEGSIGAPASWAAAGAGCAWLVWYVWNTRRQRARYSAESAPAWLDVAKVVLGIAAIVAFVAMMVAYPNRTRLDADGDPLGTGIGIPVLLLIGVVVVLSFLAHRTRFGRHVFAYGGNPESVVLAGINTRFLVVKIFIMMGILCTIAAVITTARLDAGTNSLGQLAELYAISAAVIGGTSLAGGVGSVPGAVVGALIIQSLDNGMVLLDIAVAKRQIFIGLVLIAAVWFDVVYTRRQAR